MSHTVAKNALYLTLASVGQKVLAFAYFLVIARYLTRAENGTYALALSLITIAFVVADLGFNNVLIRDTAKDQQHALRSVRLGLGVRIPAVMLAAVVAVVASRALHYTLETQYIVLLATGVLAIDAFSQFFYAALRGLHVLAYEAWGMLFGQLITMGVGITLLVQGAPVATLVGALVCGSVLNLALSAYQLSKRLGVQALLPAWDSVRTKEMLKAASPFFLAAVFVKLYSYIDTQFLYALRGTEAVAVYSVAYKFTYAFQFLPLAFVAALYPGMSALVGKDTRGLSRLFERAQWYMLLLALPLAFGLSAVAPAAVRLAGAHYADAAPVLGLLAFALIPSFLDFPIGSLLNAAGRQGTNTMVFGGTMVLNAILNATLIPMFGMTGAVVASLVSLSTMVMVGLSFVSKVIPGYEPVRLIMTAIPMFASASVMYAIARVLQAFLGTGTVSLLVTMVISGCVYAAMLFLTGAVTREDIQQARALVRRKPDAYADAPADA